MGKGILLELNGRDAVVLTPQGEFKQVPRPRRACDIGDEVEYAESHPAPLWRRWGVAAAAAALLVLSPVGYQSWSLAQPVAVVSVDINPSLELTVNKRAEVLRAASLNADGELVLRGVDWKRKPVEQVVADLTTRAISEAKLDPTDDAGAVVVAVAPAKEAALPADMGARVADRTKQAVGTVVAQQAAARKAEPKAHVLSVEVTAADKKEAKAKGITPGDLVILKKLEEQQVNVAPQQLIEQGPGQLLKGLGINPGTIFGEGQDRKPEKDEKGEREKPEKGSEKESESRPVSGQPDDKSKSAAPKDDNTGKSGDKEKDKEKEPKSNSNSNADPAKGNAKPNENGKKDDTSWTVPLLEIKIPKPAFLNPGGNPPGPGAPEPAPVPAPASSSPPDAPGKSGNAGSNGSDKVGNKSQPDNGQKGGSTNGSQQEKEPNSGNKKK